MATTMTTTNENIRQLLEMLDHPEAYTEQQIHDIIHCDEDTRETYRLMVEAKRSCRNRKNEKNVDVDAAWQRFRENEGIRSMQKNFQSSIHNSQFRKIAASFIGVLLVSGIAFAAIHIVQHYVGGDMPTQPQETQVDMPHQKIIPEDTAQVETTDTIASKITMEEPVVFDNVPLSEMLGEIAARYDATVSFANDTARQLRFRFVWNPQQGIDQVVSDLNQFESISVTLKDNQITVE